MRRRGARALRLRISPVSAPCPAGSGSIHSLRWNGCLRRKELHESFGGLRSAAWRAANCRTLRSNADVSPNLRDELFRQTDDSDLGGVGRKDRPCAVVFSLRHGSNLARLIGKVHFMHLFSPRQSSNFSRLCARLIEKVHFMHLFSPRQSSNFSRLCARLIEKVRRGFRGW